MKMLVEGVKLVEGKAKASGLPFAMCRLICRTPIEPGQFGPIKITGYGNEVSEMELDPELLQKFSVLQGKFPLELDIQTDQRSRMGKYETFCVGFSAVPGLKAAGG